MPPRFNLFQDVVAIIERHKAAGTVIKESAELIDRDTGEKREVDVKARGGRHSHLGRRRRGNHHGD